MSQHDERRQATRDAFLKSHQMGYWQEMGKFKPVSDLCPQGVVDLTAVRRYLSDIPKVTYCAWCGRSIISTARGMEGTALDFECDAPPIRTHIEISGLKQLGVGR